MSHANKNHHRKVKHHSSGPGAVQDTTGNNSQGQAVKNKEAADSKVVKKTNANTTVEKNKQNKTNNKTSGVDISLHLGDSTLQSPEEHRKDEQTDQTKTDKTEVNF